MEWDADLGVWKGERAASYSEIPNPLYIFGYGSLLWRPGDLLSKYDATPCVCFGWQRLFAQRSMDHRGTTQYPGFVATLVSDTFFHQNHNNIPHQKSVTDMMPTPVSPSECVGIAFLVPNEDIDELIAELDYREKGGYHRHVISVKLLEKTLYHEKYDLANALVYTGPTDNPNFSLEFSLQNWETLISRIISISVGPSGENAEYLLQLAAFVGQQLQHDEYLEKLARVVFNTMCPWRGRLLLQRCNQLSHENELEDFGMVLSPNHVEIEESVNWEKGGPLLLAWGSNESYQLSGIESFQYHFKSTSFHLRQDRSLDSNSSVSKDHLIMTPTHVGTFSSTIPQTIVNKNELYNPSLFHYQVYAAGSRSAIQCHTHLYLWGDITSSSTSIPKDQSQTNKEVKNPIKCWRKTFYLSEETPETSSQRLIISQEEILVDSLVIPSTAHSSAQSYEAMTFTGVESIAMGHHHNLILSHDRTSVLAFGDDEYHQCSDLGSPFLQLPLTSFPSPKLTVAKLSAGLQHSALLTTCGLVYTWGDSSYGQCIPHNLTTWKAPQISENESRYCGVIPRVMDICCGAHHTVLLDTIGRVYTFGSNRYGQLGREIISADANVEGDLKKKRARVCCNIPTEVEWRDISFDGIKWNKISSGWSHIVLQGISLQGEIVFTGWGRCDMGQLPSQSDDEAIPIKKFIQFPTLMLPPSLCSTPFIEIWCGSEYTVGCTEGGELWSRGWREHGNLGHDSEFDEKINSAQICRDWIPVKREFIISDKEHHSAHPLTLKNIWNGKIACGGAHCIALIDL